MMPRVGVIGKMIRGKIMADLDAEFLVIILPRIILLSHWWLISPKSCPHISLAKGRCFG